MKILFLSDDFPPQSFGGAGIVAFNLAKALQRRGHFIFVTTTAQNKDQVGEEEYQGLKVSKLYANYHERWNAYFGLYNSQTVKKVSEIIKQIRPDVVHAHNIHRYLSYHCLKLAKESGAKVFLTAHDSLLFHYGKLVEFVDQNDLSCPNQFNYKVSPFQQIKRFQKRYNPFRNIIIRHYLKYVDKIFAVSDALKEALNQNGIQNVEVVHNGINVEEWQIEENIIDNFKIKYNLQDKKVILFGGRLSALKGGEKIILAMQKVIQRVPNAVLLVLGQRHGYAEKILELAKKLGIENNIIFTDWLAGDELKAAYWVCDLVAVPSLYLDPFPTINLEAMACKKPIIGTCFGGTSEVVLNNETGYIVNPFNLDITAEKIVDLLLNEEKAREFGLAGYKRVKENFSLEKQAEETLRWYNL